MLCIVYVSQAKLKENQKVQDYLREILLAARSKNILNDITTIAIFRHGKILQLIEGEPSDVDNLYKYICEDDRHDQVNKIIDIPIKNRSFSDDYFKLILNIQEDSRFVDFIANNKEIILSSNKNAENILKFFGCPAIEDLTKSRSDFNTEFFSNKNFALKKEVYIDWFEIDMLDPEKAIAAVQLCEFLVRKSYSYDELMELSNLQSDKKLTQILNTLDATGSLLYNSKKSTELSAKNNNKAKNSNSFGHKLLKWLKNHK